MAASAQGFGIDQIVVGPLDVHDHVRFNFHIPIENDPYPHQFIQDYGFDGADLLLNLGWHWGGQHCETALRVSPVARHHFAFDQDTDFEPTTTFTHGDEANALGRTLGIAQKFPDWDLHRAGQVAFTTSLLRQSTTFGYGATYDINSNPVADPDLPDDFYDRDIPEHVVIYQIDVSALLQEERQAGAWVFNSATAITPLSNVTLHDYIPQLEATDAIVWGLSETLGATRRIDDWELRIAGVASKDWGYEVVRGFWRETFGVTVQLGPPAGRWF